MDKLKEIFANIRDRITNPFVFSFLCSWLVSNWQITISLLWYDKIQIEKTGAHTIFDFISNKLNFQQGLLHPLFFATGYTLAMPVIKNLVSALHAWATKWGNKWNLSISKGGKIPFERYLKFRDDYDKQIKLIESIINKESENTEKYDLISTELLETRSKLNNISQERTEISNTLQQLFDVRILNGYWTNTFNDTLNKRLNGYEDVFIQEGKFYLVNNFSEKDHVFNIVNFYFDNRNKTMFFIKERVNFPNEAEIQNGIITLKSNINILNVERSDLLVGRENGSVQIQYQKKNNSAIGN